MRASPLPLIAAVLALWGLDCAHASSLPVCSGKHRRPANPYGSVLSERLAAPAARVAPPSPAKPETSAAPPAAATGTAQQKDPAPAATKASLAPCGTEARP